MLDYRLLYEDQPEDVKAQMPEDIRAQLEEGTDAIILDEEELTGEYAGGEIFRIRAVDFRQESEGDEEEDPTYSCRLELTGLIYPEWDEDGPNEDEEGNRFFSMMAPFRTPEGKQSNPETIPGEKDYWLKGFKSYRISIEDMAEVEMIDQDTYKYLNQKAKVWVDCIEKWEGDTQAPYQEEDDDGNSLLGKMMGYLSCSYIDFEIDIRPVLQYGSVERYGIHNINVEQYGLKKLAQSEKVSSRKERLQKKGGKPIRSKEMKESKGKSNSNKSDSDSDSKGKGNSGNSSIRRRRR